MTEQAVVPEPVAAPPPKPARRPLPLRVAGWASAVIGFVASVLGVVFLLFPAIKPQPPPTSKGVVLSNAQPEQLSTGQYFDRTNIDRKPYPAATLGRRGLYVTFDVAIQGYRNEDLPIRCQLVDADSGEQVAQSNGENLFRSPVQNEPSGSGFVWVALPPGPRRRVYAELYLYKGSSGAAPISNRISNTLRTPIIDVRATEVGPAPPPR